MFISRRHRPSVLPDIKICNESLEYIEKATNLGVIFQSNFEWDDHINSQCCKIYAGLRHLKLTAGMLPVPIKIKLFKSLLLPHLSYGLELVINASAAAVDRLRIALNSCVRWVFNLSWRSRVTHLQRQLLGCSYYNFFKLRCCVTLFKIIRSGPSYLSEKLLPFRSNRVRNFILPQYSTSHYGSSFFVRAVVYWNQLPAEIKTLNSLVRFHQECINWLNEGNSNLKKKIV